MILADLESILPEKYFSTLLDRVGNTSAPVARIPFYEFTISRGNDFVAVWPSKATGDWIRILNESFNMGSTWKSGHDSRYKKMVAYNSNSGLLVYADCTSSTAKPVAKPVIPPL